MNPIEFLMSRAKICAGTMGPFAFVARPDGLGRVSNDACGPWARTEQEALAALRVKVTQNTPAIVKEWERRFGKIESEAA